MYYEFQQRNDYGTSNFNSEWVFEGSNDNNTWSRLDYKKIKSTDAFSQKGSTKLFSIKSSKAFHHYRIRNVEEKNSLLIIQKFDIYGYKCETYDECKIYLNEQTCQCNKKHKNILLYIHIILISYNNN